MAKVPPVYDQYSRPPAEGLDFTGQETRTKMEFAAECDLNVIMARYIQTGELPAGIVGTYGDFSTPVDFHTAQNILARASQQFEALPGEVRARFQNDPAAFLEFVHDEKNLEEANKLGLLTEEAAARLERARAVPPVAAVSADPAPSLAK